MSDINKTEMENSEMENSEMEVTTEQSGDVSLIEKVKKFLSEGKIIIKVKKSQKKSLPQNSIVTEDLNQIYIKTKPGKYTVYKRTSEKSREYKFEQDNVTVISKRGVKLNGAYSTIKKKSFK